MTFNIFPFLSHTKFRTCTRNLDEIFFSTNFNYQESVLVEDVYFNKKKKSVMWLSDDLVVVSNNSNSNSNSNKRGRGGRGSTSDSHHATRLTFANEEVFIITATTLPLVVTSQPSNCCCCCCCCVQDYQLFKRETVKSTVFPYQPIENANSNTSSSPDNSGVHATATSGAGTGDVPAVKYPFDDPDYRPYKAALEVPLLLLLSLLSFSLVD